MRVIDLEDWPRKEHFLLYRGLDFPHVNMCLQLDITELWDHFSLAGASKTVALVYCLTRAANRVPELRQRIRGEQVVEHEVVHPSITVLGDNDLFGLATLSYQSSLPAFALQATEDMTRAKDAPSLKDFPTSQEGESRRDDLLSITILPWLAFTSFAITRLPTECIPLLAIGKVQPAGERHCLPFYVNFHHALADGLHIARFAKYIEEEARELASRFSGEP